MFPHCLHRIHVLSQHLFSFALSDHDMYVLCYIIILHLKSLCGLFNGVPYIVLFSPLWIVAWHCRCCFLANVGNVGICGMSLALCNGRSALYKLSTRSKCSSFITSSSFAEECSIRDIAIFL